MTTEETNKADLNADYLEIANNLNASVKNMRTGNGNDAPNQFIISTDQGRYFQSYTSIIAFIPYGEGKTILGNHWDYSVTTGKYRNEFLGETKKETLAKIKSGEYIINPKW